jgi:hypothetical protein
MHPEASFESFDKRAVGDFDLTVGLWVADRGKVLLNLQLAAKILNFLSTELCAVVRDKNPWESEPTNDVLPQEVNDPSLSDGLDWFCLNPLREVFDCHDEEFLLSLTPRKRSDNIYAPFVERTRDWNWIGVRGR